MTQRHYVDSVRDDAALDPQFSSLLRHHWMEEAQHAKLDTLMVEALAEICRPEEIDRAVDELSRRSARLLDGGLQRQVELDLEALRARHRSPPRRRGARAPSSPCSTRRRAGPILGSGMTHPQLSRHGRRHCAPPRAPASKRWRRRSPERAPSAISPNPTSDGHPSRTKGDSPMPTATLATKPVPAARQRHRRRRARRGRSRRRRDPAKGVVQFHVATHGRARPAVETTVESYRIGGQEVRRQLHRSTPTSRSSCSAATAPPTRRSC